MTRINFLDLLELINSNEIMYEKKRKNENMRDYTTGPTNVPCIPSKYT